jgi:hypothetical protein
MVSKKMIVTILLTAIVALTGAGCSDDNPVSPTTALDTAPPAVPANLSADYSGNTAVINWDLSTVDTDLAGYIVVREHDGVTDTLVSTPSMISSYQDMSPQTGTNVYHVYAVDHVGNMSAVATVSLTFTLGHQSSELNQ